ncbi:MAG TPA: hypothetical protein VL049_01735 [Candidatus Dormibacteraeota bacterium]|nr:hypothetical protein [Candidatus Dormibacteraeota bacterium]
MKRFTWLGLLAIAAALTTLQPSAVLAGTRANRPAPLIRSVFAGTATVDQLVALTAARCQCAPAGRAAAAAVAGEPSVDVGSTSGAPGTQATFVVTLSTAGASVAGVQADIAFDSINTPLAATGSGRPDCTVNPDIAKEATAFAFQPPGCSGASCTAFRALVLSFSNVDPIPDGSVLYSCNVNIAAGAAAGSYPLIVSNVGMSTPDGQAIASTGTDGEVLVTGGPSPTPTATPALTATPAPVGPTSKDQCKNGGWRNFTVPRVFKNQGDCIQFVNTGK